MPNDLNHHDSYVTEAGRVAPPRLPSSWERFKAILKPLSSLQLTVTLFALSMVLVFYGTLAQKTSSTWTAVDDYFRSPFVMIPNQLTAEFLSTFFESWVGKNPKWGGSIPFPGGQTLGALFLLNLIAAHVSRFKLSWKRSGIVVVHLGIILLLLSELFTGLYAVESVMYLKVGDKSNYLNSTRESELAFILVGDPKIDEAFTVPQAMLRRGAKIADPKLPVDIEVVDFWKNSLLAPIVPNTRTEESVEYVDPPTEMKKVRKLEPGDTFLTLLDGQQYLLAPWPEVTGVESDRENFPCVWVKFFKKGTSDLVGEYRLTQKEYDNAMRFGSLIPPTSIEGEGQKYRVMLRNRRIYKPYVIELKKFDHEVYEGTQIPRNFQSTVDLVDGETGYTRDNIRIWMNNPLRYRGESFFQHQTMGDGRGTVLLAMKNPTRFLPYLSCLMVTLGLVVQFYLSYRTRSAAKAAKVKAADLPVERATAATVVLTLAPILLAFLWLASKYDDLRTASDNPAVYKEIARLPVKDGGRLMPLDAFARTYLQSISDRSEVSHWDETNRRGVFSASAVEWVLDTFNNDDPKGAGSKHQIFRIDNDELLGHLELKPRPGFYRYSIAEIAPQFARLQKQVESSLKKEPKEREIFDEKVLLLRRKIEIYLNIAQGGKPHIFPPEGAGGLWRTLQEQEADRKKFVPTEEQFNAAGRRASERIAEILKEKYGTIANIPEEIKGELPSIQQQATLRELDGDYLESLPPVVRAIRGIIDNQQNGKADKLQDGIDAVNAWYAAHPGLVNPKAIDLETRLNFVAPFYHCSFLYLTSALMILASLLFGRIRVLSNMAFYLTAFALLAHTAGLLVRMDIQGRPPVTNLYSSAIFIGWFAVVLTLVFDRVLKSELPTLAGNFIGAATLMIAYYYLAASEDTLGMLQAVLDTDFWLATHVTCVTIGYAVTFLSGFLAILYVGNTVLMSLTRLGTPAFAKKIGGMMYGSTCIALLFSFTGTVLGGLWADYSWGRFWGWDPKENGAVLVVIWNALILHARWCGLVKERGIAVLAIAGNMVTTWSWFGTNQLGIGLHAYGFDPTLADFCRSIWLAHIGIIAVAVFPWRKK